MELALTLAQRTKLILGAALFMTGAAAAQAQTAPHQHPEIIQGAWADQNCATGSPELLIIYARSIGTVLDNEGVTLWFPDAVSVREDVEDGFEIGEINIQPDLSESTSFSVQVVDGALVEAFPPSLDDGQEMPPISEWEAEPALQRCETIPPLFALAYADLLAGMEVYDKFMATCGGDGGEQACRDGVWSAIALNGDALLTTAEVARMTRIIGALLAGSGDGGFAELDRFIQGYGLTVLAGPLTAQVLMQLFDYDGDLRLSVDEVLQDRPGLFVALGAVAQDPATIAQALSSGGDGADGLGKALSRVLR